MVGTRKDDVVETIHGVDVPDPYRWLEDEEDPEVARWVEDQNRKTGSFLDDLDDRDAIRSRLTELWDYPKYSLPNWKAGRYFYWRNEGLQNQPVFHVREALEAPSRVVLDPNTMSDDGTVAVSGVWVSETARRVAYAVSEAGSDRHSIFIRDLDSGEDLNDRLRWCKFASVVWTGDGGFYYTRFPRPGTVPEGEENLHHRVFHHRVGTPQSEDELVYERKDDKELLLGLTKSDDRSYLVMTLSRGTDPNNRLYYRSLDDGGGFVKLFDEEDASYTFLGNEGTVFYIFTDREAPRGRIVAIDTSAPGEMKMREVICEGEDSISSARMVGGRLVVVRMHHAHHRVAICDLQGRETGELQLPELGTVTGISGRQDRSEMFIGFSSFLYPQACLRRELDTGEEDRFGERVRTFDASAFVTRQVFFRSGDGTRIPMFITHRKGIPFEGQNPTMLYGYGGFRISMTPSFSPALVMWLEQGGVYAVANIRGGGEYGREWHRAGMLEKKQNVFDDFIQAAEHLIDSGYTSPGRLAIRGGSNGGLLVAACMVQRPELFGAVLCHVPLTDMLRFHRFTVGRYWTVEYGTPEREGDFRNLLTYSPLHNVEPGTEYPATLLMTADTDDRVVPAHARKFAAALQEAQAGPAPILLRTEVRAGHGHGKPTEKEIEEAADLYTFLFKVFGLRYGDLED